MLVSVVLAVAALVLTFVASKTGRPVPDSASCTLAGAKVVGPPSASLDGAKLAANALSVRPIDTCGSGRACMVTRAGCADENAHLKCDSSPDGVWTCVKTCARGPRIACISEQSDSIARSESDPVTAVDHQDDTTGGGTGDPHMFGFDGSRFDFHGRAHGYFAIFGRQGGDMLVTQMRPYKKVFNMALNKKVEGTLFRQFGLQVAGTAHNVRVFMQESDTADRVWDIRAELNGEAVTDSAENGAVSMKFMNHKRVVVNTKEHSYSFVLVRFDDKVEGHINIEVGLNRMPQASDRYLGVLGTTLNRKLGHDVNPDFHATARDIDREIAMAKAFEVGGLYPNYEKTSTDISGVIRVAVAKTEVNWELQAMTAGSTD